VNTILPRLLPAILLLFGASAPASAAGARLSREHLDQLAKEAKAFFEAGADRQASFRFDPRFDQWLLDHEQAVRAAVWKAYREAAIHAEVKKDFAANQVCHDRHLSRYTVKKVGKRPANGWPLFIALHGGGGAPKKLNDEQWKIMQIYYRDQASVTGYQYLALRAPNDAWNGFYADHITPLVVNLVRQFLLLGDVDPDKVFLMGYSHGGYGAFFIGPKVPDRFAAVHASAAAQTDGAVSPRTLRNTPFTFMVGEHDTTFGRRWRCEAFDREVCKLREGDPEGYPVKLQLVNGHGHVGLPDRDKIKDLYVHTRKPVPRRLVWDLTDSVVAHFFWLAVPLPRRGSVVATVEDNTVKLTTRNVEQVDLHLDSRLVRFNRPLRLVRDGKTQTVTVRASLLTLCRALLERGDPVLAWTCTVPAAK
jgi:predicted esterase